MAASADLLLSALSKRTELQGARTADDPRSTDSARAGAARRLAAVPLPSSPLDDRVHFTSESTGAEAPLTSEPPLADAAPLTSEPPLSDEAPLTSEPATAYQAAGLDPSVA